MFDCWYNVLFLNAMLFYPDLTGLINYQSFHFCLITTQNIFPKVFGDSKNLSQRFLESPMGKVISQMIFLANIIWLFVFVFGLRTLLGMLLLYNHFLIIDLWKLLLSDAPEVLLMFFWVLCHLFNELLMHFWSNVGRRRDGSLFSLGFCHLWIVVLTVVFCSSKNYFVTLIKLLDIN